MLERGDKPTWIDDRKDKPLEIDKRKCEKGKNYYLLMQEKGWFIADGSQREVKRTFWMSEKKGEINHYRAMGATRIDMNIRNDRRAL